jgi:hypothetical protein
MMKKTLIASAVASAFSLNAFADGHVGVGGYMATGFDFGDTQIAGVETDGKSVGNGGGATININASQDLDSGNSAYVLLVYTTDPSNAGTTLNTRAGRVGLRGDFGDVAWGSGEMVYEIGQIIDGHGADWNGSSLQHTSIAGGGFNFTRVDSDVLIYSMNQVGMVKPTIVYGYGNSDEITTDVNGGVSGATYDDSVLQLALDYNNGAGLSAQFAYAQYTDVDAIGDGNDDDATDDGVAGFSATDQNTAGAADATGQRLTVKYDTGGYTVAGTYQSLEIDHAVAVTGMTNSNYDGKTWKRDTMYLNLTVPTATGRINAGYGTADDVSVDGVSVNESGSKTYYVSYSYDLSAAAYLFAYFAKTDNEAQWDLGNTAQDDATTQLIGLKVSF